MSKFEEREKSFEAKYARDQEKAFKISARRNKLFGLWAAERMGLTGEAAEAYAREVIKADFEEPGSMDVFRKVWNDLQAKGVDISEHRVMREMERFLEVAREQIENS